MEDDASSELQNCLSENPMETDESPLINENSNGLSHLLTDGEFSGVDAAVDESSVSNQGFLNAVELSAGSVGDYLESNAEGYNTDSFDVGDMAVNFPTDSMDADSRLSAAFKLNDYNESDSKQNDNEMSNGEYPVHESMEINDVDNSEDNSKGCDKTESSNQNGKTVCSTTKDVIPVTSNDIAESYDTDVDGSQTKQEAEFQETGPASKMCENSSKDKPKPEKSAQPDDEAKQKEKVKQVKTVEQDEDGSSKIGGAEETEVVSEDELPVVEKPSVKDAENVSDDELPGPKPAELPADTEVVSEDELPASKKETNRKRKPDEGADYDPESPTSEKKQAVAKNGESKPIPAEKRSSIDEKPKKKALPELDKYWKVVNDDPTDFTGWTYLLQYVDQESDAEAAREAYDAFLSHYPYCYGYWRKYADYEKRKGSKKKCLEVLERGLRAIPLSVDLWIHYLNHIKSTRSEEHAHIRSQYERAVEACGLEFRSDRLWESYIKWEAENGSALNVTEIYDRLLSTPTLGYTSHFDNFQEHVMSEPVAGVVSREELVRLRAEVREGGGRAPAVDLPPGEDEPVDHVASEEEAQAIKERVIAARRKVHKSTGEEVAARWTFEEGIKRPYFHVKPLERCQLKNWKAYLEWEKQHGSFERALVLHERCLIACALYEEFWMRLIKFLEEKSEGAPELVSLEREVLERACTVHHHDKPELHLHWAHFEEAHGHPARAAEILDRIEKTCPQLVQIQYRRINLERRRGDLDKCVRLYEGYIAAAKTKSVASALSVKYARFLTHVKRDPAAARKALDDAVERDPLNARLHLQRLDLAVHCPDTPYERLEELVRSYEKREGADPETSARFAWRWRELAEELGGAAGARAANRHARALDRHLRKRARKDKHEAPPAQQTSAAADGKKKDGAAAASSATATSGTYYGGAGAAGQYDQSYAQPYQPPWGYQQPPAAYQPHAPWPQYPNYY
ncbi:unnamed protein product [Pieris macdunnoughi]|uniref:Pre-mRNA-processing factor 39 n=1 Tax=Pieris macdunnoughi TaxID=345717 RepID=A0A821VNB4_9NEOP|nr:unnamed protein product [Pieris macdunnoughi]